MISFSLKLWSHELPIFEGFKEVQKQSRLIWSHSVYFISILRVSVDFKSQHKFAESLLSEWNQLVFVPKLDWNDLNLVPILWWALFFLKPPLLLHFFSNRNTNVVDNELKLVRSAKIAERFSAPTIRFSPEKFIHYLTIEVITIPAPGNITVKVLL